MTQPLSLYSPSDYVRRPSPVAPGDFLQDRRRRRGRVAGRTGRAAEEQTLRRYQRSGWRLLARNWHAERMYGNGEIDLILRRGQTYVFVEVKARRTLTEAANAVTPAQQRRLELAALRWLELEGLPDADMRFDLAAVDRWGEMEVFENFTF